jgi:hypothetical protein
VDPPKKGGPSSDNDDDSGALYPGEDGAVHMIFGESPARPSRRREAHPTRGLQRRHCEAILPKVVRGSNNLRPQGPSRPCASASILPTSGSSPVQVQMDPQGPDGWGKRDQCALCVNA